MHHVNYYFQLSFSKQCCFLLCRTSRQLTLQNIVHSPVGITVWREGPQKYNVLPIYSFSSQLWYRVRLESVCSGCFYVNVALKINLWGWSEVSYAWVRQNSIIYQFGLPLGSRLCGLLVVKSLFQKINWLHFSYFAQNWCLCLFGRTKGRRKWTSACVREDVQLQHCCN